MNIRLFISFFIGIALLLVALSGQWSETSHFFMMINSMSQALYKGLVLLLALCWVPWHVLPLKAVVPLLLIVGLVGVKVGFMPTAGNFERVDDGSFRFMTLNTSPSNQALHAKTSFIDSVNADVVTLAEVPEALATQIEQQLKETYPYTARHTKMRMEQDRLMVLSKYPFSFMRPLGLDGAVYQIDMGRRILRLGVMHPLPPINTTMMASRNEGLEAPLNMGSKYPTVIMGDMNTVYWHKPIENIARKHGLIQANTRATWPALLPAAPIDLIMVPDSWAVAYNQVVRISGTDHLAVIADVKAPDMRRAPLDSMAGNPDN